MNITISSDFAKALNQPYAWPGGYELSFICDDGLLLCYMCARENGKNITDSIRHKVNDGWRVIGVEVLYEGGNYCEQCGKCLDAYPAEEGKT